jgi:hypothetical protein
MKSKLAAVILLGLAAVGGLFLLKSWNGKPVMPLFPNGTGEQPAPSAPAQVTQQNLPPLPGPGTSGKDTPPGAAPGTATALAKTPNPWPGTSQQTPTPATPILLITPAILPTEGFIGKSPTPPGRLAPDYIAAPLKFEKIRIFMNDSGQYSGIANVSNTGETFLNSLVIKWQLMDKSGSVFDQGQFSWPNLAPGETATVSFAGTNPYNDLWEKVVFEFKP